jgi:2-polyprenyl-6-methoxyphenol hydroxylase-like FAD-dependent oxidoreductase
MGFVVGLWSNGMHTLEPLHVRTRIEQFSIPLTDELIRDETGTILTKLDYQHLIERFGPVFLLSHGDLHAILRELTEGIPIHFETTVKALEERPGSVSATLSNGIQADYDLVVGADGVHSHVRELLFGKESLSYSGLNIWLYMMPARKDMPTVPTDLFGEGTYVGIFPRADGKVGVLFLASVPTGQPDPPEGRIARLRELFSSFEWLVPEILQSMQNPAEIFHDEIEQVSLETWYRGRVLLLGDAAHAVSPTAAMGGAMALEDAYVLAEELRKTDTVHIEQALAAYVARRKPRLAEIRRTSDFLIWLASIKHPVVTFALDMIMRLMPPPLMLRDMEAILAEQI